VGNIRIILWEKHGEAERHEDRQAAVGRIQAHPIRKDAPVPVGSPIRRSEDCTSASTHPRPMVSPIRSSYLKYGAGRDIYRIGSWGEWTLEAARSEARKLRRNFYDRGVDPNKSKLDRRKRRGTLRIFGI